MHSRQFIQALFYLAVTVGSEKITLLILSALLLLLLSFTSQSGAYYSSLSCIADYFWLCVAANSVRSGRQVVSCSLLESTYNYLSLQLPSSAFFVALEGASFNAAANTS